ncbi:MAG: hypothetical protein ACJASQ_003619 [Crocinitomicaceae bacterium]
MNQLKKFLLILIVFVAVSEVKAQDLPNYLSSKEVTTITYWEVGDQFKYKKTEEKDRYENGKQKATELISNNITLTVKQQSDSSYLMELAYSNFQLEGEGLDLAGEIIDNLNIQYVTDETGMFDSITNAKELVTASIAQVEKVIANSSLSKKEKKMRNEILKSLFTENNIEALFVEDILLIHNYYGLSFVLNDPSAFETVYPTFGDIQLNGELVVTLKSIDKVNDKCILSGVQKPNAYELDGYMNVLAKEFGIDDELSDFSFSSKARDTYEMQLSTGTMNKVTYKQTTKVSIDGETFKLGKTIILKLQD